MQAHHQEQTLRALKEVEQTYKLMWEQQEKVENNWSIIFTNIFEQVETVYKREKRYNDEAGGRLSGDMDDTRENGDKVIGNSDCFPQRGDRLMI